MFVSSFKKNKVLSHRTVILVSLFLFITPALVFSQDKNSITTLRQMGRVFADISAKASPAVVWVTAERTVTRDTSSLDWPFDEQFDPFEDDFFDYFFRRRSPHRRSAPQQRKSLQLARGSGFIISEDGYILTNNHIVAQADKGGIKVILTDKREFEAELIGTDPDSEVAVLKIDTDSFTYLELADSDKIEVGEWVLAIGNPFGLSRTVTAGIVSAKGRNVGLTEYENFIQTDAAINPGNSGGPLINLDGKVVGINTAIISRTGGNMGIGLAIPINTAKGVFEQLIETGKVVRGFLGISMTELTPDLADAFDLKDTKGVAITEVVEDSAAEKAGLKHNDVIIEFQNQPIEGASELKNRVAALKPGTKVQIVIMRDGKRKKITAELGEKPTKGQLTGTQTKSLEKLGLTVQNLTDDLAKRLGYEDFTGVIVTQVEPDSQAALAGIKAGVLIQEVNRKQVANTKEFNKAIEKAAKEGSILLLIKDQSYTRFVLLKIPKK